MALSRFVLKTGPCLLALTPQHPVFRPRPMQLPSAIRPSPSRHSPFTHAPSRCIPSSLHIPLPVSPPPRLRSVSLCFVVFVSCADACPTTRSCAALCCSVHMDCPATVHLGMMYTCPMTMGFSSHATTLWVARETPTRCSNDSTSHHYCTTNYCVHSTSIHHSVLCPHLRVFSIL